jgi:small subunit ribosomal protein S18
VANPRNKRSRTKPADPRGRLRRGRPKVCLVCTERLDYVDYKNSAFLRRFMSDRGKIKSRANTGTCVQHQHDVAIAIKNAREMALLPYAVRTMAADKGGGRRGRGSGPGRSGDRPAGAGRPPRPAEAADAAASDVLADVLTDDVLGDDVVADDVLAGDLLTDNGSTPSWEADAGEPEGLAPDVEIDD